MSRGASTVERLEEIKDKLRSSNCKAEMVVEYWDGSSWVSIDDLDAQRGVDIEKTFKKYKYASFALTPQVSTCEFSILNDRGKYSPGSGTEVEDIFDMDTRIRVRAGYVLPSLSAEETEALSLSPGEMTYYYHCAKGIAERVTYSPSDGEDDHFFQDLLGASKYGEAKYDEAVYSLGSYFVSIFDAQGPGWVLTQRISVSCSHAGQRVYARSFDSPGDFKFDHPTPDWTLLGSTEAGTTEFDYDNGRRRFTEVAVLLTPSGLEDPARDYPYITGIEVAYKSYVEWVYKDVFYLDTPEYDDPKLGMPSVKVSARDIWKRAIETEVNLPDLSPGMPMDDLVKLVCDTVGIPYAADSIADLSAFGSRTLSTGLSQVPKAAEIFEMIMQVLNQEGKSYNMYLEYDEGEDENILHVQPTPDYYLADFVFNYRYYDSIGSKRRNYDQLLKRLTLLSNQQIPTAEVELASGSIGATGTLTLSWSGKAEYKRYEIALTHGSMPDVSLTDCTPTSLVFSVSSEGIFGITITAYGDRFSSAPAAQGEYIDHANMVSGAGSTSAIVNPLVLSDADARSVCKGLVGKFGRPVNEANDLKYPYLHLLLEQNDMALLWSRFIFVDDLYFVTGISYHWDRAQSPADTTVFNLNDSGLNFGDISDFEYDEFSNDLPVMFYDIGYVYDMRFGPQATAEEIDAGSPLVHNIGKAA